MGTRNIECRKFSPNIFNKSKCTHCFRQREEHSAAALECNRATRKVSKRGYLFVAPDWDFSNPLYRTKRWQRRWFVLYDDGELTYSVDEHPETIPQAIIDMTKVLEVSTADAITSHPHSIAITAPERVTFVKGTCPEETKWWYNVLVAFPKSKGRHKRNATFPGGQATAILQAQMYNESQSISTKSTPPTRDKLAQLDSGKAAARLRTRHRSSLDVSDTGEQDDIDSGIDSHIESGAAAKCLLLDVGSGGGSVAASELVRTRDEPKLKDIANTITNVNRWSSPCISDSLSLIAGPGTQQSPQDENTIPTTPLQLRPQSLSIPSSAPAIVSAIVKKIPTGQGPPVPISNSSNNNSNNNAGLNSSLLKLKPSQTHERGDPDGDCGMDEAPASYLGKSSEHRVPGSEATELLHAKKGWLQKQDVRTGDWSKHWFTLRGAALFYYRDPVAEEKGVLDGVLDVNSITSITELPVSKGYGFQLMTWDNHRIVLSTGTINIRNNWINVLKNAAGLPPTAKATLNNNSLGLSNQNDDNFKTLADSVSPTAGGTPVVGPPASPLEIELIAASEAIEQKQSHQHQQQKKKSKLLHLEKNNNNNTNGLLHHMEGVVPLVGEDVVDTMVTPRKDVIVHLSSARSGPPKLNEQTVQSHPAPSSQHSATVKDSNGSSVSSSGSSNGNNTSSNQPQPKSVVQSPVTPLTPKSLLFSSDSEEYRTASEGGRRDSVGGAGDWGSPVSPLPPAIPQCAVARTKDRVRTSSSNGSPSPNRSLHKRSRSSPPTSRRSTLESGQPVDSGSINTVQEEETGLEKELQLRLQAAEKELSMLREETHEREARMSELLTTLERTEQELTRKRELEENREKLMVQLQESRAAGQDIIEQVTHELNKSRETTKELEDRLARGIEENESLYRKLQECGITSPASSLCSLVTASTATLRPHGGGAKIKRMDSFSDLTFLSEIDPATLDKEMLADEYRELRARFERAVSELKAMKRELKDAHGLYDDLEIGYLTLQKELDRQVEEHGAQSRMMADRIQDMTNKYTAAEKQVRQLKQKMVRSEKRRSLSLKGKESLSIQKELEEKVSELESKIDALEAAGVPIAAKTIGVELATPEVVSPVSQPPASSSKPARSSSSSSLTRLRRKSLDSASLSSQPMQVLLRLTNLEKRVDGVQPPLDGSAKRDASDIETASIASTSSTTTAAPCPTPIQKVPEHLMDRLKCLEGVVVSVRELVDQSVQQFHNLRSTRSRRSVSPIADKKDSFRFIERCLAEVAKLLRESCDNCIVVQDGGCLTTGGPPSAANSVLVLPDSNPIKLALSQLEAQLKGKLSELLKQRRMLRETNGLTQRKDMELLAERIAFESVCFGRLRHALERAENLQEFEERQSKVEVCETIQLMSLLKAKLAGKCAVRPSSSVDVLASVLARKLMLSAGRTSTIRTLSFPPIGTALLDDLLRQQNEVHLIAKRYKTTAMENLAYGLAAETLSYISSSHETVQGAVQEAWRQAQEAVNAELVQSEIAHIMMRNAQRYENSLAPAFGYALSTQERITFETFADAVHEALRREMDAAVAQLTECYEETLAKMKRGQWRLHLEQERKPSESRQLLGEFADIIAHKALIDARVLVLKGDYVPSRQKQPKCGGPQEERVFSVAALKQYENLYTDLTTDLEVTNADDILAEADFNFMYKYFTSEHSLNKAEVKEVSAILNDLERSVVALQGSLRPDNGSGTNATAIATALDVDSLRSIHARCVEIQQRIDSLISAAKQLQARSEQCAMLQERLQQATQEHERELTAVRQEYEQQLDQLQRRIDEQQHRIRTIDGERAELLERLNNERNLLKQKEKELHEVSVRLTRVEAASNEKDKEIEDLLESYDAERKRARTLKERCEELTDSCRKTADEYAELEKERDYLFEEVRKEQEHVRKLEKHLELLETEHAQQIDNLHAAYREQQMANELDSQKDKDDEDSLRSRYQAEIQQLRALCEKGLAAMEASHKRIIHELEEKHQQEIAKLILEKEQALAEETQATLAALDAMKKAHQNEVQREVTRFKQEFLKQFQKGGQPPQTFREKEQELEEVRLEILSLSEKYSMKCVETASLEEKLRIATQQLKCSQQHIQQLDVRNKQLRAHFISNPPEEASSASPPQTSSNVVTPKDTNLFNGNVQQQQQQHEGELLNVSRSSATKRTTSGSSSNGGHTSSSIATSVNTADSTLDLLDRVSECQHLLLNNKKEAHPRLKFTEGAKLGVAPIFSTSTKTTGSASTGATIIESVNLASSTNNNRAKVLNSKQLNMNLISGGGPGTGALQQQQSVATTVVVSPTILSLPLITSATLKNSNLLRNTTNGTGGTGPGAANNHSTSNNNNSSSNNNNNNNNSHMHNNNISSSNNNNNNNNNNDNDNMHALKPSTKHCSPPPLDERDVEQQIHRFELEI
ncbi:protein outspread-like isoform X3 [Anopheles albimanus]|uniref:protein outspread-like isoform X3 n=1 Tax=Anopheles albimanus TaxID=7167 RepID=UPI001641BB48|nr:protein outspread-like isoform X3 [Anopheles albimanus]